MPNLTSFANLIRDWSALLRAYTDNAELLAPAEPQRSALEKSLLEVQELKARQESHAAIRQQTTQELEEVAKRGREEARRLRGMVKGLIGTKNERLVQFKVAPLRTRSRTAKKPEPTPPPVEPEPGTAG